MSVNHCRGIFHIIYRWEGLGARKLKFITFYASRCYRWYCYRHSQPCLRSILWANEIKSRFFFPWASYDSGMIFGVQWNEFRYVTMYCKGVSNETYFLFSIIVVLLKIVLATILSLFESTKLYLWTLRLISHAFHENLQQLSDIFDY